MYDLIKDFQTLIAGILVLIGVVVTLWQNASVARKQRENQRDHERENLRVALLAELQINRFVLIEKWNQLKPNFETNPTMTALVQTDVMDDNYLALLNHIGLLTQIEVNKVMTAYLALRGSRTKLSLIGKPVDGSRQYVNVKSAFVTKVLENLTEPLDQAIESLEEHLEAQTG